MAPKTMPFDDLARSGGPEAYIRGAARQAGDREARRWLTILSAFRQEFADAGLKAPDLVEHYLRRLRRRLGLRTPPDRDRIRAQTRERVRRFRARRAGGCPET
jgi:hypothetical protein